MIRLLRWFAGYVEFEFCNGFYEGFINDCFKNEIDIKKITLCDNGFTAQCLTYYYKGLHRLALRHGGRVRIIKKCGLPFYLHPLKNRAGFPVGCLLFVVIISLLGGFVWNVEIIGNDKITTATISAYLENNNLKSGVMWSSVDRKKLEFEMMRDFEQASWVHINKIGTTARVEINEITEQPVPNTSRLRGETVFRKELSVSASRQQSKIRIVQTKKYYTLHFFMLDIPLYLKNTSSDFEEIKKDMLIIKERELPVGYTEVSKKWLTSEKYDLNDDELLALARKKLSLLEQTELDEYEIVNQDEQYNIDDDKCEINCSYVVRVKD